jgi:DNA-binding LytR/AlgR family response regulator
MASVLVLEDDYLTARLIGDTIACAGHTVVGPAATVDDALAVTAEKGINAALLDINLGDDQRSFELARILQAQHIPFAFLTGYSHMLVPPDLRACPRIEKPFGEEQIVSIVDRLLHPAPDEACAD